MTVLFVLTVAACLLLILANYKTSGDSSAEQESESPCETCLRWYECNGVDEDCPLRKEVK